MNDYNTLHKELDLIQGVISRMARNSFYIKGWMMTLSSFLLSIYISNELENLHVLILLAFSLFEIIAFWYLDSFYLHKEKCYIKLYNYVINNSESNERPRYSLNYKQFEDQVDKIFYIMMSKSVIFIYIIPLTVISVLSILKFI